MKDNKCLCDWKSVEPKRQGNALCEYIQGHQGRKALRNCKAKYRGLDVIEAIFRGPQNKYSQCMCRWDKPGDNPLISCNELQKIKKGEQSKQEARETCRSIYGSSVTWAVPNTDGPECYCGGKKLCSTTYNKCKTTYGDFKSLGKKNACMCTEIDEAGQPLPGLALIPCKHKRKSILPAVKDCEKKYRGLKVLGGSGQGGSLKCDCFYNGKTDNCENIKNLIQAEAEASDARLIELAKNRKIKKAMQTCRKRHKKAKITRAVSTERGTYCYCGGKQLCYTIYSTCKTTYGKKFTHINSENECMCGDDLCKDHWLGDKLQQCINKNKDIYPSGVTVKKNGTCICGKQTCDELRRSKISSCKQYESLGYTEFKNGHCMCGNKKCKDKQKPQKSVDPKCFKKFKGLTVIEGLDTPAGLKCRCLHKGKRVDCDKVQKKKTVDPKCFTKFKGLAVVEGFNTPSGLQCRCLHKGKRDSCENIKIDKAKKGFEKCKKKLPGLPVRYYNVNTEECMCKWRGHAIRTCDNPPKHEPEYQKKYKQCQEKFGKDKVLLYNADRNKCICRFPNKSGDCDKPPSPDSATQTQETLPIVVPLPEGSADTGDGSDSAGSASSSSEGDASSTVDNASSCTNRINPSSDQVDRGKKVVSYDIDCSKMRDNNSQFTATTTVHGNMITVSISQGNQTNNIENYGDGNIISIEGLKNAINDLNITPEQKQKIKDALDDPEIQAALENLFNSVGASSTGTDTKSPCKRWQKKKYFKRKGRVKDRSFCSAFASSKKDCGEAFEDIRDQIEKLRKLKVRQKKLEESLSEWEDKKFDAQFSDDEDEDDTEASGFCTKCLADLRKATGPTGWQRFGSGLSMFLGGTLSAVGLAESRRAQNSTNELLALQGMPAENNFGYSMAGLSLGYPFVARGLHGLTHGNTSSLACNRHASPYQHPFPTYPTFY